MMLAGWEDSRKSANPKDWYIETDIAETIIRQLLAERDELRTEIDTDNQLLAERNRILEALPCPVHGPCVPYVLEFIKTHKPEAPKDYRQARGILPWQPGDEPAETSIRRLRDESPDTGEESRYFAQSEEE